MRKMEVLGIPMKDLTIRESMKKVEQFFADEKVSTIALITMKGLIKAQDSSEIKEWMSSLDMTVAVDVDILHAADINYRSRIHDVENNVFISEFLKKLVRQRKTVYLMSQTEESLKKLEGDLLSCEEGLRIVGKAVVDDLEHDDDFVINDMNMKTPWILISNLESPKREQFLKENNMKMNVRIWMMLRADKDLQTKVKGPIRRICDRMMKRWFQLRLIRYQEQMNKEDEQN